MSPRLASTLVFAPRGVRAWWLGQRPRISDICWGIAQAAAKSLADKLGQRFPLFRTCIGCTFGRSFDWSIFLRRCANFVAGLRPAGFLEFDIAIIPC
jgi:hypothetical protein